MTSFNPFDYQSEKMIPWFEEREQGAYFCSPGLGKSVCTLKALDYHFGNGTIKGTLIVAPIRVCNITWPDQVERWDFTQWMTVANMRTPEGQRHWENGTADIYLVNPEMLASRTVNRPCKVCRGDFRLSAKCRHCVDGSTEAHYPGFVEKLLKGKNPKDLPIDSVVYDELSLAKDMKSKRFNAIRAYSELFKLRWGLTGTPAPNTYLDLWAQMRMLDDGKALGKSFTQFRQAYFYQSGFGGYKWSMRDGAREKIHSRISDTALTLLSEDYLDVPTCSYEDVEVTLPSEARIAYRTLEQELLLQMEEGDIEALNAAALTQKLLQITGGAVYDSDRNAHVIHDAKIKALSAIRKAHKGEPVLVLTQFLHEKKRLLEKFPDAELFDERKLGKWKDGKIPMWVADPRSMSHGIDGIQHGGRIGVWFTPTYSNETYIQTNARLVRTGQTEESIIYRLIARDTADEAVIEALRVKGDEQNGLFQALKNLQRMRRTNK